MALPTDPNIDLILCDAVRGRPDGKLDLAGFFPIPEIKLDASVPLPAEMNLTFIFVVKDGEGQFRGRFRILDPLGAELHLQELEKFTKRAESAHLVMLAVNRIPVVRSGNFQAVLEIEGQEFRRAIRIFQ